MKKSLWVLKNIQMKIPELNIYEDGSIEQFDNYIKRWPTELKTFPKCLVKNWIHRHWPEFKEWLPLNVLYWKYEKRILKNDEIITRIRSFTIREETLDAWGKKLFSDSYRQSSCLAKYMLENGTTPAPILVLENFGKIIHPDITFKNQDGFDSQILQLIEGHLRTSYLKSMIKNNYHKLKPEHEIWVASI